MNNEVTIWDNRPRLANLTPKEEYDYISNIINNLKSVKEMTIDDWIGFNEEDPDEGPKTEFYDIRYIIGTNGEYQHVQLTIACGGPTIIMYTQTKDCHLYWGGDHYSITIDLEICEAIDDHFEQYYDATRS